MSADLLARLDANRDLRYVAKPSFGVQDVPPSVDGSEFGGMLPPPGSVVVYVGSASQPRWQVLREAAAREDWAALRDTNSDGFGPSWADESQAVEELLGAAAYFDVRCAGRTLYRYGALPDGCPWATLTFPYTGGAVADSDFEIVEYRLPDGDAAGREYLVLRRAPRLSRLEEQLLARVDPQLREIHLGPYLPHDINCVMDGITNDIAAAVHEELCRRGRQGCALAFLEDDASVSESVVEEIVGQGGDPAASVTQLLRLRRGLLSRS